MDPHELQAPNTQSELSGKYDKWPCDEIKLPGDRINYLPFSSFFRFLTSSYKFNFHILRHSSFGKFLFLQSVNNYTEIFIYNYSGIMEDRITILK